MTTSSPEPKTTPEPAPKRKGRSFEKFLFVVFVICMVVTVLLTIFSFLIS